MRSSAVEEKQAGYGGPWRISQFTEDLKLPVVCLRKEEDQRTKDEYLYPILVAVDWKGRCCSPGTDIWSDEVLLAVAGPRILEGLLQ